MKKIMALTVLAALVSGTSKGMEIKAKSLVWQKFYVSDKQINEARLALGNIVRPYIIDPGYVGGGFFSHVDCQCFKAAFKPLVEHNNEDVKVFESLERLELVVNDDAFLKVRISAQNPVYTNVYALIHYITRLRLNRKNSKSDGAKDDAEFVLGCLKSNYNNAENAKKKDENAAWWPLWFKRFSLVSGFSTVAAGLYYYYSSYYAPQMPAAAHAGVIVKTSAAVTLGGVTAAYLNEQRYAHEREKLKQERLKLECDLGVEVVVQLLPRALGYDVFNVFNVQKK